MEEGRQQRALSPCVIWTRQGYALMFPVTEASVLCFCGTRWFSAQADDRRFFVWRERAAPLFLPSLGGLNGDRQLSIRVGEAKPGLSHLLFLKGDRGSKAERHLYNEQRKSQGGNNR